MEGSSKINNVSFSFYLDILKDLHKNNYVMLSPLITIIEYYYNDYKKSNKIELIDKIKTQLVNFQTYRNDIGDIFDIGVELSDKMINSTLSETFNQKLFDIYNFHMNDILPIAPFNSPSKTPEIAEPKVTGKFSPIFEKLNIDNKQEKIKRLTSKYRLSFSVEK